LRFAGFFLFAVHLPAYFILTVFNINGYLLQLIFADLHRSTICMKLLIKFLIGFTLITELSLAQSAPKRRVFNKDFNWSMTIPENFQQVNAEEWKNLQNKGKQPNEVSSAPEPDLQVKTLLVFKSDQFNYLESNFQPFDDALDGDYLEGVKKENQTLFNTFKEQIPGVKIDSATSQEHIGGITFYRFTVRIALKKPIVMEFSMFNSLINKRDLTVNIMTVDSTKQKSLMEAWRGSTFGKN